MKNRQDSSLSRGLEGATIGKKPQLPAFFDDQADLAHDGKVMGWKSDLDSRVEGIIDEFQNSTFIRPVFYGFADGALRNGKQPVRIVTQAAGWF